MLKCSGLRFPDSLSLRGYVEGLSIVYNSTKRTRVTQRGRFYKERGMTEGAYREKRNNKITLACHCVRTSFLTLFISIHPPLTSLLFFSYLTYFSLTPTMFHYHGSVLSLFLYLLSLSLPCFRLFLRISISYILFFPYSLISLYLFLSSKRCLFRSQAYFLRDILYRLDCTFFELLSRCGA